LDLCRLRHLRLHIINAFACVLYQPRQDLPVPDMQAGIFIAQADLSPDQAPLDSSQGRPCAGSTEASRPKDVRRGANRSAAPMKGTSGQLMIASNALVLDPPKRAFGLDPRAPACRQQDRALFQ
jgi:hypothetical protein